MEEGQEETEGDEAQHHTQNHEHCRCLEILFDCVWVVHVGGCCVIVMIELRRKQMRSQLVTNLVGDIGM